MINYDTDICEFKKKLENIMIRTKTILFLYLYILFFIPNTMKTLKD